MSLASIIIVIWERSLVDVASSLVLVYDLPILELFVKDPPKGHALFEGMSIFTVVWTIFWTFLVSQDGVCSKSGS